MADPRRRGDRSPDAAPPADRDPEPGAGGASAAGASTGDYAPSALPSTTARALAFASILVGGLCGGLIGWAVVDLQCTGDCGTVAGAAGLLGAVIAAGGVAVVAVLALRAMGEWRTVQHRQPPEPG